MLDFKVHYAKHTGDLFNTITTHNLPKIGLDMMSKYNAHTNKPSISLGMSLGVRLFFSFFGGGPRTQPHKTQGFKTFCLYSFCLYHISLYKYKRVRFLGKKGVK